MKEDQDSAGKYRQRAEELRLIAAAEYDPLAKRDLLLIADQYDRLAATREWIDKTDRRFEP